MLDRETIWSMDLGRLAELYRQVLDENDPQVMRELILADRFFLLTMVLGVKVAWHPWVLDRCREVERDPDEHLDLWSRGHFKSTIITFAGVVQYVLANPEHAVCIMSYKSGAAQAFLSQIKVAFENNEILLAAFPDVLWSETRDHKGPQWSVQGGIVVKRTTARKESTVDASGLVEGMRTGGHYDLLVYDDAVTLESVGTVEMSDKTTAAWSMSLNLGTLTTKHWYIGTRYATYDTYATMMKTGTIRERRHIAVDALGNPVLLPLEEFRKKRSEMSDRDWASQMMQTPIGVGELLFREDWFRQYRQLPDGLNYYIFVDTALAQKKTSDYTVMTVVGLGRDRCYYVADIIRDKLTLSGRADAIFGLVEKWQPQCVFWEKNASRSDGEYLREKMDERGWHFNLREINQTSAQGSKQDRIGTLEPLFRESRIWYPLCIKRRQYDGTVRDLVHDFLREEFTIYPSVTHDDMLDCLANIQHPDCTPTMYFPTMRRSVEMPDDDRDRVKSGSSSRDLFGR